VVLGGRGKWVLLLTGLESEGKSWSTLPWQLKIIGDCNGSSLRRSLLFALVREKAHISGQRSSKYYCLDNGKDRPGLAEQNFKIKSKMV
jgi:hypothetical protein